MAKYRLRGPIHPYVAAGGVLRYVGPVHAKDTTSNGLVPGGALSNTTLSTTTTGSPTEFTMRTFAGLTAAVGVTIGAGRIRWQPEARWTHWTSNFGGPYPYLNFPSDQVELLIGIRFR